MAVLIKMCGFTREEDVEKACELGVELVGVILVPGSPRRVSLERAKELFERVRGRAKTVAVLRPKRPEEIWEVHRKLGPEIMQVNPLFPLHELERKGGGELMITVSVPPHPGEELWKKAREAEERGDYVLLDTEGPLGGGTGETHDWSVSRRIREVLRKPVFLAGGLHARNVRRAIEEVRPDGVDVSSGIEVSPGIKDARLMREFVEAVRA
ncbi:MAG: phosphoribosylanthranilate isomerase [Candidatus Hadarchaeales archaeon]